MDRVLILKPMMLLADESSLRLSSNYKELAFDILVEINKNDTSVLLNEHNTSDTLEITHRAYAFRVGKFVLNDTDKICNRMRRSGKPPLAFNVASTKQRPHF